MDNFRLIAAPLQGFTDAAFRHYHARIFGCGAEEYGAPFMRMEKGEPRRRDMRDITSSLNSNHRVLPQVICRDAEEFRTLCKSITEAGLKHIDLNMGCPFRPQVLHGRGAGLIGSPEKLAEIALAMNELPAIGFSIKMRLGITDSTEWRRLLPIINRMPLTHIALHPRTAQQQYSGLLHIEEARRAIDELEAPVVFNGEIGSPEDIEALRVHFPKIAGVMAGRGLLRRPSLFAEWREGSEWPEEKRMAGILELHEALLEHYRATLCGEAQIMSKIKPFWEWFGEMLPHKARKAIRKARTLKALGEAVQG